MAAASRPFQIFVKPAGSACNLACRYCYYLDPRGAAGREAPAHLPVPLLRDYIVQHIEASPDPVIAFSWHGGEPTIAGLDYFRTIVALQQQHCPPGRRIMNGLQTNGVLLDEPWARFLAAEGFGVGLSLDGPADLHDAYRVDRGGKPTLAQAVRAFRLLRRHRVACDVLCAVHNRNVAHPISVYRFFKDLGAAYVGFLPVVERGPGGQGVSAETVPPEAYGDFLCAIFDEWRRRDQGRITVQIFEEAARAARGLEPALCVFRRTCGDVPVLERAGDVYTCDHFVDDEHRLGDLRERGLLEMLESPALQAFGQAKLETLPRICRVCEVRAMCNGGCPKDRFALTPDGEPGLNYLCAGLKRFFTHALPHLVPQAAARDRPGASSAARGATEHHALAPRAGRNDPCPCGSGRKFKKCCGAQKA